MKSKDNIQTVSEYGSLRIFQNLAGEITHIESVDRSEVWITAARTMFHGKIHRGDIVYLKTFQPEIERESK